MIRFFCFLFLFIFVGNARAQPEPQFTQYMYNKYLSNPAYAGSEDVLEVALLHRSQYLELSNRFISSQGFNFNIPVYAISSGVGLTAINDLIGFQRATYVSVNYDYRKKFRWGKLGIGIGVGFVQTSIDGSQLRTPEGSYNGGLNHNDDFLPLSLQQGVAPDFALGIYFNSERYFAGAAVNHVALSSARINSTGGITKLNFPPNLLFSGGYDFIVSRKFRIMPSAFIKTDIKKIQFDISGTLTIIDNILTGISFRGYTKNMIDALALILGVRYKGFQAVYSYDANVSYLTKFNTGTHEISISYRYPLIKRESRGYFYYNPRFN
ncbi:MAG: type IX secretion system membrane protein PorP/SprF [Bacteroidota bacterium]